MDKGTHITGRHFLGREEFQRWLHECLTAWSRFYQDGIVPNEVVHSEVLESWKRSKEIGVNPEAPNVSALPADELARRIEDNRLMIQATIPFLQTLVENLQGMGFRVDLVDKDLYILAQIGKDEGRFPDKGPDLGMNRDEFHCGTNAINLSAYLKKPVQLVGPEHYSVSLHQWTCSAVPILSPDKQLLGIICMAGPIESIHRHTLGMVIALGKVIEQSLQQWKLMASLELTNDYLNNVIHSVSDGLIVVNTNGIVTTINQSACKSLGLHPQSAEGMPIDRLLEPNNPFSKVLSSRQSVVNKEIMLKTSKSHQSFIGTLEPVSSREGFQGVIGVLKPLSSARKLLKNTVGLRAHFDFNDLIGDSSEFRKTVQLARQVAKLPTTVLLQGESGTGKELFAQSIHNASPFNEGPFVAVNCAAIPGELVESELFGYENGAFTGARKEGRPGKFEFAGGGTLFLDEINSMPLDMQTKLLRVIQNKTVMRVGGMTEIPVTARLIFATNSDLWQRVKEGVFREDLFYRINIFTIIVPPLRSRIEDIPLLYEYFSGKMSEKMDTAFETDPQVYDLLHKYHWPGNIRELENLIERSAILTLAKGSNRIEPDTMLSYPGFRDSIEQNGATPNPPSDSLNLLGLEIDAIERALGLNAGNLSGAARLLGIHRSTLYRKMKQYSLLDEGAAE